MMITRLLFRKNIVVAVFLALIFFLVFLNGGKSSQYSQPARNSKQETVKSPPAAVPHAELEKAGEDNNNRLWQAWMNPGAVSDSVKGRIYDYLFDNEADGEPAKEHPDSTAPEKPDKSSHVEKINQKLTFDWFLYELFDTVFRLKPDIQDLDNFYKVDADGNKPRAPSDRFDATKDPYTIAFLKSFIELDPKQIADLKSKHAQMVEFIHKVSLPVDFYKKNSAGIVYVGGGKYTWFAMLSIKNVRKVGSNLPIELFIPTQDEYEYVVCEEILPKLNAKCVLMYELLKDPAQAPKPLFQQAKFKGFTYKSLALLLSSFENILLLDADNVPFRNPDILFSNEPYASDKLVVWPDYWQRTTSPYYYDIAGLNLIKLNEKDHSVDDIINKIHLHSLKGAIPDPSTESGQLLISKSKHWDVLLLSLYYNVYGPEHYYHLLSQGASGQGDKETFLAAATVLNSTFYQVTDAVYAIGHFKAPGSPYRGTAQGQKSPIDDYNLRKTKENLKKFYQSSHIEKDLGNEQSEILKKFVENKELSASEMKSLKLYNNIKQPDIFFVHESTPKLDPVQLIAEEEFINDEVLDPESKESTRIRFYANFIVGEDDYPFEKFQMDYIYEYLCELNLIIRFIETQIDKYYTSKGVEFNKDDFCRKIDDQRKWLAKTK